MIDVRNYLFTSLCVQDGMMKKLKLDLARIRVDSFTMEPMKGSGGTVNGFAPDTQVGCGGTGGQTDGGASCRFCDPEPISYDYNC
jgi:hypothetical protein